MAPFDTAPPDLDVTPKIDVIRDEIGQLLWDGAQLIRKYGHVKGTTGNESMGFCVVGALSRVGGSFARNGSGYMACHRLNGVLPHGSSSWGNDYGAASLVCSWNNAAGRTKEEVIAAMEGAARA